jgi:hypothetical protein
VRRNKPSFVSILKAESSLDKGVQLQVILIISQIFASTILVEEEKKSFLSPRSAPLGARSRDVNAREERSLFSASVAQSGAMNLLSSTTRICAGNCFIDDHQRLVRASLRRGDELLFEHSSRAEAAVAATGNAVVVRWRAAAAARPLAAAASRPDRESQMLIYE